VQALELLRQQGWAEGVWPAASAITHAGRKPCGSSRATTSISRPSPRGPRVRELVGVRRRF
jgi:hypothetical protein